MKSPTYYSPIRKRKEQMLLHLFFLMKCGNVLLSHTVSRTVPSALCGLTSVFGMRTGGSHMILSPQWYIMPCAPLTLATGVRLRLHAARGIFSPYLSEFSLAAVRQASGSSAFAVQNSLTYLRKSLRVCSLSALSDKQHLISCYSVRFLSSLTTT